MYQILGVMDKFLYPKPWSPFSKSAVLRFRDIHCFPENWQKIVKMADFGEIKSEKMNKTYSIGFYLHPFDI